MTYRQLCEFVSHCGVRGLQVGSIGWSVLGRRIPYVRLGVGKKNIIVQASIHAREYSTTDIAVMQIERMLECDLGEFSVFFVPMVNPDGVELCLNGLDSVWCRRLRDLLLHINCSKDFVEFKANANCVDLNTNFDARWGQGASNVRYPDTQNYIGAYPQDQPETAALVKFSRQLNPISTLSYHSRGREIYWDFFAPICNERRDRRIADVLGAKLGYSVVSSQHTSAGGYKDWCIEHLGIPSFTVEMMPSDVTYPIPRCVVDSEFAILKDLVWYLIDLFITSHK